MITEKKQVNSNITLDNIYNAIRYLKPEHQGIILSAYKFMELYDILSNDEEYNKYISNLFAIANEYSNRAIALMALHTEAFMDGMKRQEKFDPVNTMCQMFDCMSEVDKKKFCEDMLEKKEFFEDAYRGMMVSFEKAIKEQEDGVGNG